MSGPLPPLDSPIYTFMPMQPGQRAVAIIGNDTFFTFRGETPLAAKAKAKKYLTDAHEKAAAAKARKRGNSARHSDSAATSNLPAADAPPSALAPGEGGAPDPSGHGADE